MKYITKKLVTKWNERAFQVALELRFFVAVVSVVGSIRQFLLGQILPFVIEHSDIM